MKRAIPLLVLIACLPFLPGLTGPFLLDDLPNLEGVRDWVNGNANLRQVLADARAGPLGRPLSMLSFVATAAMTGMSPYAFKATNLILHLFNGLLVGVLLHRLFARQPTLSPVARNAAWCCAAIWTLLPLHVPTVLYAVQRMTLLSASFALLALVAWVVARERLERGQRATLLLWGWTPALTLLSALAKENGLLVPLCCMVLELTLFAPAPGGRRPAMATWFLRLSVEIPLLLAAAYLASHPEYVFGGYYDRSFSLGERLLSQPRALWEYAILTFVPDAGRLGLYQDTFAKSTGWWSPVTTGLAILGWMAVAVAAIAWRRRCPGFAAGMGLFLAGHLMEGSVIGLELFFIHRNYLPSIGLVLAVASLVANALRASGMSRGQRMMPALFAVLLLAYGGTTAMRAWVWGDLGRLMTHELAVNPNSLRLRSDLAVQAMQANRFDVALAHLDAAERSAVQDEGRAVRLWRALVYCSAGLPTPPTVIASLNDGEARRVTPYTMRALDILATQAESGGCRRMPDVAVVDAASRWLDTVPQGAKDPAIWKTRYALARLYAITGELPRAQAAAIRAFDDSNHVFPVGVLAFQLSSSLDDRARCRAIYEALRARPPSGDLRETLALQSFAKYLDAPP